MKEPIDLRPGDHYKCLGDTEWRIVPELRTASVTDLIAAIGAELRRHADDYASVLTVDEDGGAGTYATATGKTKKFTFSLVDGIVAILTPAFAPAENAVTALADYDPLASYAPHLANLKAARAAELSRSKDPLVGAEERYKARRTAEFAAEAEWRAANPVEDAIPRMTAAEEADLEKYAPPDSYGIALKALRKKENQ